MRGDMSAGEMAEVLREIEDVVRTRYDTADERAMGLPGRVLQMAREIWRLSTQVLRLEADVAGAQEYLADAGVCSDEIPLRVRVYNLVRERDDAIRRAEVAEARAEEAAR